ncbi:MAG: hypothetical protein ACK4GT_08595 [Pararhodobacter sp.]
MAAATAMALCLAVAMPASAQTLSPAEAWAGLQALAEGAGLSVTSTSVDETGSAMTASGVRIAPSGDPNAVVISMDTLRIEPRGERVVLIPSANLLVDTRGTDGISRQFQITHDGEISGMISEESAALDLDFPRLTATLLGGAAPAVTPTPGKNPRPGATANESFMLDFTDLGAALSATQTGDSRLTLSAAEVTYDLSFTDHSSGQPSPASMSGTLETPELTFDGTQLALLGQEAVVMSRAFAAGLSAHLTFASGPSTGWSTQVVEGVPVTVSSEAGPSSMSLSVAEGRFDAEVSAEAGRMAGSYGPMSGDVTFDGLGLALGMPLVVTPDDQPARYAFRFENVTPSPELLTMVGAGEFAGDSITLVLDLGAQTRLTRELDFEDPGDEPPFEMSTISLDEMRLAVGDAEFTGTGALTLIGGLAAQMDRDRPEAEGDFVFNLIGGNRLLTRLQAMGLVPNDQMFFVRMMMNGLGRSVGEDHLVSDVAVRPGGLVTVNGAPLPF